MPQTPAPQGSLALLPRAGLLSLTMAAWALLAVGPAMAQLGPLPGLPQSALGAPNGAAQLDNSGTASSLKVLPAGTLKTRALGAKLGDLPSLLDYGAACDGTTDDSAAIVAAQEAAVPVTVPAGRVCYGASVTSEALQGFQGPGQIKSPDGTLRGPISTALTAPPATRINLGSINGSFSGDIHAIGSAMEHSISGATTLGQPATGYSLVPEASARLTVVDNTSGWNQSLASNTGRTGFSGDYLRINHYGQGDAGGYFCDGLVVATKAGATSYLANPALGCFGGQIFAAGAGDYITGFGDMNLQDTGLDVAAAGTVFNFYRSTAAEKLGANWVADIRQTLGAAPLDAYYRGLGPATLGIDLSAASLSHFRLGAFTLPNAGSGYVVGDTITVQGGASLAATVFQVLSVSNSGAVTGLGAVNAGIYTSPPVSGTAILAMSGGTGAGLQVSGQYVDKNAVIVPPTGGCMMLGSNASFAVTGALPGTSGVCVTAAAITLGDRTTPTVSVTAAGATVRGHTIAAGAVPTLSSCGSSTLESGSSDNVGVIDFVGSPTACQLNFAASFGGGPMGHPVCVLTAKGVDASFLEEGDTASSLSFAQHGFGAMTNSANYMCR